MVQWLETPALKPEDPIKSLRPTHSVVLTPTLKLCVAYTCTKSFFLIVLKRHLTAFFNKRNF